jgi:hypothetical protein
MENPPIALPAHMSFGASFFFSIIFGLIGTVYFMYGKKEQKYVCMLVGIGLGIYPYFIRNAFATFLVGIALMAVPFYVKD